MDKHEIARLIQRHKAGLATPDEVQRLEKLWLNAREDTSALENLSHEAQEALGKRMFQEIQLGINRNRQNKTIPFYRNYGLYKAAAAVIILVAASVWLYTGMNRMTEIRTGFGERLTVTLPDHSSVILNSNSVLRYADNWNGKDTREVWIKGEGFFAVTHTTHHQKFIVHASDQLTVEVLGTKFNVKARPYTSEVMLTEGKVKLGFNDNSDAPSVFLKPGELATMNKNHISKKMVKQQQYTSWVENKLFFDRTPLKDVAVILKETYGFQVTFKEPGLAKRELSGEISSATAEDVLFAIAETFSLTVEKEDQSVIISSKQD